jgi:hypothetical protein
LTIICYLATVLVDDEINNGKQITSSTGHFNSHADTLEPHVQGYIGSHWTLPLGNNSLRIAPAATRATINKTTIKYKPPLLAIMMAIAMRQ